MRTGHAESDEAGERVTPATRLRQPSDGVSPAGGIAAELELADWRREVSELYAAMRSAATPRTRCGENGATGCSGTTRKARCPPAAACAGRDCRTGRTTPG